MQEDYNWWSATVEISKYLLPVATTFMGLAWGLFSENRRSKQKELSERRAFQHRLVDELHEDMIDLIDSFTLEKDSGDSQRLPRLHRRIDVSIKEFIRRRVYLPNELVDNLKEPHQAVLQVIQNYIDSNGLAQDDPDNEFVRFQSVVRAFHEGHL